MAQLVTIRNKVEEPMLNYLKVANQEYLGHLTKVKSDLQHLLSSFDSLCYIKHFKYAMEIRIYTTLLEKVIRKGTTGLSEEERERIMEAYARFANNDNDQLMQALAERFHSSRVPSIGELQNDFLPCMNRAIFDLFVPENVRL